MNRGDQDDQGLTLVTFAYILQNRDRLAASGTPIYRLGTQGGASQAVAVSLESVLVLSPQEQAALEFALPRRWVERHVFPRALDLDAPPDEASPSRWVGLLDLTPRERIRELIKCREQFEIQRKQVSNPGERAAVLAEVAVAAFEINRASMSLEKAGATAEEVLLVKETKAIIKSVVEMMAEPELGRALFDLLRRPSLDFTYRHTIRVFSTMVGFLLYYQESHARGIFQRVRLAFKDRHRSIYRRLLPAVSEGALTADNVVRLSALSIPQIRVYALGALLHDLGRVFDLDHGEGLGTADPRRVHRHPILGSGLFLRTYGLEHEEARYIVGDHHNQLFHPDGYGLTRWERNNGRRVYPAYQCCITDSLSDFTAGQALGFFPVEVCGLVDLFDGLTHPDSGEGLTVNAALDKLREEALIHGKVDPILVDLFTDYLHSLRIAPPPP